MLKQKIMANEPTIEQKNEVIALFDGLTKYDNNQYRYPHFRNNKGRFVGYAHSLEYHTSWDWLMPVWKRLTDIVADQSEDGIYPNEFSSIMDTYAYHCEKVEIAAAHNYVYQGIVWLNQQKQAVDV